MLTNPHQWHRLNVPETAKQLESDLSRGLAAAKAAARLEKYGPNELMERGGTPFWKMLLDQFNQFLIIILIISAIISFALSEWLDGGAILAIVIINAVIGVVQQGRAEQALAALKKMAAPEAKVIRDGHQITVPAGELVPGDVVVLETGNYIPADLRLIESVNLRIDEASLTGESVPVEKRAEEALPQDTSLGDRRNCAYMSTIITYGRGRGIVTETGMSTEIGRIAEMIQSYEEEPTPLQVKLDQLGKWLGGGALLVCGVVFVAGWLQGRDLLEMFMVAVSLAIAAVPEGLPAVVTICLALGLQRMVRRNALIRKLPAVETLGSATAICSDKTGTLTQNEMTAVQMYVDRTLLTITGEGYRPHGSFEDNGRAVALDGYPGSRLLLRAGALCNDAYLENQDGDGWRMVGDPTEGALVVAAAKAGFWQKELAKDYPRLEEVPFDSTRKRMTTIHPDPRYGGFVAYVKGAPDLLLELCSKVIEDGDERPLTAEKRRHILTTNESLASNALRVLGVAYRPLKALPQAAVAEELERDLTFIGLIGMIDPARPEVKEAIALARHANIRTVMVTGDYKNTALAIAKELNLITGEAMALTGAELDALSEEAFEARVAEIDVYARVSPTHKVRIVEALKKKGHVVAMTGDGVNDAPALKRANIGVAMGITGTDVSKETAEMVLTDDNYASIVAAIEEGRIIYSNIRKFVFYLLSCNMGEIAIVFLATLFGWPVPLTAIQLLTLNLVTDGLPALALGMEKGDPDIMDRPPRPVNEPVINREMLSSIVVQMVAITAAVLSAFAIGRLRYPHDVASAQTMAFVTLSISELLRAYTSRSEHYGLHQIGVLGNRFMQWAVLASLFIILAVTYLPFLNVFFDTHPLSLRDWLAMLPLMLVPAMAAEINKWVLRRNRKLAPKHVRAARM
ncbi:MAG: cation-translocating P-type ATPase [Chloroflexota bacterium]